MRSFIISISLLALAGSVHMQQSNGLGGLLGGLGLGGGGQGGNGLLGGLLGRLSPNGMQQGMGQGQGQNPLQALTGGLGSVLGNGQNQNQAMRQPSVPEMISQLPRRTLEILHQLMNSISRGLPGANNQAQMQQMGQQQGQGLLSNLPAPLNGLQSTLNSLPPPLNGLQSTINNLPPPLNGLPNTLNGLTNPITQSLSQGRLPDANQLTSQLTRTLSGLTQPQQATGSV